jgi:hypothetical protein
VPLAAICSSSQWFAMVAGHYTMAADPGAPQLRSSASAMPRGTFHSNKVSFRLPTPRDKGIGLQVGVFRQPEVNPMIAVHEECAGNFARGRGACLHYRHMQQRAKYLVPSLPVHSRVDELNRVHSTARQLEMQRLMALESLELNEQRRRERLRQAKTILHDRSLRKEISQKLQASCSLPDLTDPCGEQTSLLQLLNRRVDYNRLKKCRSEMSMTQRAEVVKQAVVETPELKELIEDIRRFEDDNLAEENLVLETVVDWKNSSTISFQIEP